MKERKKLITEETEININMDAIKPIAEELICELFVDYVNNIYQDTVVELKCKPDK
jgi:hypothetical protein